MNCSAANSHSGPRRFQMMARSRIGLQNFATTPRSFSSRFFSDTRLKDPYTGRCGLSPSDGQPGSYQLARWVSIEKRACVYRFNSTCLISRPDSNGRCNTIWYKLFFKGGVYEARETVRAFRGAEARWVASLEGGSD